MLRAVYTPSLTVCLVGFFFFCPQAWSGRTTSRPWRRAAIFGVADSRRRSSTARRRKAVPFCPEAACFSLMSPSRTLSCEIKGLAAHMLSRRCRFFLFFFYSAEAAAARSRHLAPSAQSAPPSPWPNVTSTLVFLSDSQPNGKTE